VKPAIKPVWTWAKKSGSIYIDSKAISNAKPRDCRGSMAAAPQRGMMTFSAAANCLLSSSPCRGIGTRWQSHRRAPFNNVRRRFKSGSKVADVPTFFPNRTGHLFQKPGFDLEFDRDRINIGFRYSEWADFLAASPNFIRLPTALNKIAASDSS